MYYDINQSVLKKEGNKERISDGKQKKVFVVSLPLTLQGDIFAMSVGAN